MKWTSLFAQRRESSQAGRGSFFPYLVSPSIILLHVSSSSTLSWRERAVLQWCRLRTYKLQQLLQVAVIFCTAMPVTKGKRPVNQNCSNEWEKSREWSICKLVVIFPYLMQMMSLLEMPPQSQSSSPASVVTSLMLRLSLFCKSEEGHSLAGEECSIYLKIYCFTSSRYWVGSIFSISSTFFLRYQRYSREQRILKQSQRSMRSLLSFFFISSLCSQNCQKISSSSSSRWDSIQGSEWMRLRQKPKRKPSKQRQMILQMMSYGAPADTLPYAAEEAVPKDQYIVQSNCMPKPSSMMSGQAETLTQSNCGCEQLWSLRQQSRAKKPHPTQLTMMMRTNRPQKTLYKMQKGVPMMQERKRP